MELIDKLLAEIGEDKCDNFSTTSFKFKKDLWEFFQGFDDKIAVEFGTHKGQTTKILSHLFKKVYTVNRNDNETAINFNKDRENIIYVNNFNLYDESLKLPIEEEVDMFLIDAGHEYEHIIYDINRVTRMSKSSECYVVFDDYGLARWQHSVNRGVNEAISMDILKVVKEIGHTSGHIFDTSNNRHLIHSEGLITKYI